MNQLDLVYAVSLKKAESYDGSADMDDTLVLTGEADKKAYQEVSTLAKALDEQVRRQICRYFRMICFYYVLLTTVHGVQVDAHALLTAWKELFLKAPWDPDHKASFIFALGYTFHRALQQLLMKRRA